MRMTLETLARTETLSDRVAMQVRLLLTKRGQNQAALARALEVGPMWVSDRLTGRVQMTLPDLVRIAEALGMKVSRLIALAEALAEETSPYAALAADITPTRPEIPLPGHYPLPDHPVVAGARPLAWPSGPRKTAPTGR